jgi:uncharacterized protein
MADKQRSFGPDIIFARYQAEEASMQFLVIGYDGTDEQALPRRLAVRERHIARNDELRDAGNLLYGVAILDGDGKMIGSVLIYEFGSRTELDEWLKQEPYVTGNVWQKIEIQPCRVGPTFAALKNVAQGATH